MNPRVGENKKEELGLKELLSFVGKALPALLLFTTIALAVTYWRYNLEPYYTADALLILESSKSNRLQAVTERLAGGADGVDNAERVVDQLFIQLQSSEFALQVAELFKRDGKFEETAELFRLKGKQPTTTNELAEEIEGKVGLAKVSAETFRMSISLPNTNNAVKLLQLLVDAYATTISEKETQELLMAKSFLQEQIDDVEKRLTIIDSRIIRYQSRGRSEKNSMGTPPMEASNEVKLEEALFNVRQQLDETRATLQATESNAIEKDRSGYLPSNKYSSANSVEVLRRKEMLLELRYKATESLLKEVRATPDPRLSLERAVQDLYKRKELEYQMFSDLKKAVMHLDLQRISLRNKIRVLDRPSMQAVRTGESLRPLMIKRGMFAAIFAVLFVFLREMYDPMVRSRKDLGGQGLIYLGSVPDMGRRKRFSLRHLLFSFRNIFSSVQDRRIVREKNYYSNMIFQNICARILSFRPEHKKSPQVISVISPTSGEGKTMISLNLARSFAKSGKRTLLVDCDLRSHSLSTVLGYGQTVGLADYLGNPTSKFSAPLVKPLDRNLEVMPSGSAPSDVLELITDKSFFEFIEAMRHYYDVILLDTPAALPCSEVISLVSASDLTILGLIIGGTRLTHVDEVIDKLQFSLRAPMGFVLNKHREGNAYAYYSESADRFPPKGKLKVA